MTDCLWPPIADISRPCRRDDSLGSWGSMNSAARLTLKAIGAPYTPKAHHIDFTSAANCDDWLVATFSIIFSFGQPAAGRMDRANCGSMLKFEFVDTRRLPILKAGGKAARVAFADTFLAPATFVTLWEDLDAEMMTAAEQPRSLRRVSSRS